MVQDIEVSPSSGAPIHRQIVAQITSMIETGQLKDGDRLPTTRLLADNLRINRNTVAHAYAQLREGGLVESRRRSGMVVIGAEQARASSTARDRARQVLSTATAECLALGLAGEEILSLVRHGLARAEQELVVCFVECNADRAKYFTDALGTRLDRTIVPLVLGEFEAATERVDLVLTTFFHLAEVRKLFHHNPVDVVAIVAAPHVQTLVAIAQVPKDRRVGIWYSTDDQAADVRDSLVQSGIQNIEVLTGIADDDLADVDLVVIPSEMPRLRDRLEGRVAVIEFGNVLDEASVRMVSAVLSDLQPASDRP